LQEHLSGLDSPASFWYQLWLKPVNNMSSAIADRLQEVFLGPLEVTVLAVYVAFYFIDLSFLGIYEIWVAYMFCMLVVVLLILSLKVLSKNRLLALIGLGIVAIIVVPSLLHPPFLSSRRR
jgi:hypothetical protein